MTDVKPTVDELFDEEDIRMDPGQGPLPQRRFSMPSLRFGSVAIGLVGFILFWWLSSIQHDRFYLVVDDDQVRIERGYFFPFGSGEWAESRAYEPFTLPSGIKPERTGAMDKKARDATLLQLYMAIAKQELEDISSGSVDNAEDVLWRAQKLQSTNSDDRRILRMLGDVAFRRGLKEVRGIQSRFDEALEQFTLAAMRGGAAYDGAHKWVAAIKDLRDQFRRLAVESGLDPDLILAEPPVLDPEGKPVQNGAADDDPSDPDAGAE